MKTRRKNTSPRKPASSTPITWPTPAFPASMAAVATAILMTGLGIGCGGARVKKAADRSSHQVPSDLVPPPQRDLETETREQTLTRRGSWSLTSEKVREIAPLVSRAASEYKIPEDIIYAVIWVESRFNPQAISPVGAKGLMQLMPSTAKYLAECIEWEKSINEFKPEFNILAGSYYIARLIEQFDGNVELALAAYNAGPTKVRRWLKEGGLPPVSIEYATMVQTARTFFGGQRIDGGGHDADRESVITDHDLDRLGLAILIAGLGDKQFGLEREDDPRPLDQMNGPSLGQAAPPQTEALP